MLNKYSLDLILLIFYFLLHPIPYLLQFSLHHTSCQIIEEGLFWRILTVLFSNIWEVFSNGRRIKLSSDDHMKEWWATGCDALEGHRGGLFNWTTSKVPFTLGSYWNKWNINHNISVMTWKQVCHIHIWSRVTYPIPLPLSSDFIPFYGKFHDS